MEPCLESSFPVNIKGKMSLPPFAFVWCLFMSIRFVSLLSVLVLASCAYALEGHIQDLTVETPGAHDAICYVYVDRLRYKFRPPQTQNISRSKEDLVIDCVAPGNRRQKVVIKPMIEAATVLNALGPAVPGVAWDYASGALFAYPDVVEVDFTHSTVKPMPLPAQNNPDIKQPEEYELEEFLSSHPRLNSDRYNVPAEIKRRVRPGAASTQTFTDSYVGDDGGAVLSVPDKADLSPIVNQMNPAPISSDEGGGVSPVEAGAPVPLYPGQ